MAPAADGEILVALRNHAPAILAEWLRMHDAMCRASIVLWIHNSNSAQEAERILDEALQEKP